MAPGRAVRRAQGSPDAASLDVMPREGWLPFLNTYRTMCLVPQPEFRRVLEEVREMRLAA